VVSIGETIWDALFLAELLEETARMNIFWRILGKNVRPNRKASPAVLKRKKPVRLFSKDHLLLLHQVINQDRALQKLGIKTSATVGIKQADTGRVHMCAFNRGKLAKIKTDEKEGTFIISGTDAAWRAIFKGVMDPFTAIVQKKVLLEGSFRDLLQQYPFFRQLFNLWQTVPVRE
jgi:putative sterol carrier protein